MKYAVIKTGGKQYKVAEGSVITVENLNKEKDVVVTFDDVLLYTADGVLRVGTPTLSDVVVTGVVEDNVRGEKILVRKYKAKVRHRKVQGHKQQLSRVKIDQIKEQKPSKTPQKQTKKEMTS